MTGEFKPIEPWEGEQLWSGVSAQACALLKSGVKQGVRGGGGQTQDDKSPDMSVEELQLL